MIPTSSNRFSFWTSLHNSCTIPPSCQTSHAVSQSCWTYHAISPSCPTYHAVRKIHSRLWESPDHMLLQYALLQWRFWKTSDAGTICFKILPSALHYCTSTFASLRSSLKWCNHCSTPGPTALFSWAATCCTRCCTKGSTTCSTSSKHLQGFLHLYVLLAAVIIICKSSLTRIEIAAAPKPGITHLQTPQNRTHICVTPADMQTELDKCMPSWSCGLEELPVN